MHAGQRTFKGKTDTLTISAIRNEKPASLQLLRPDTPVALTRIIERCLEKNAADRYQTAEDFCAALTTPDHDGESRGTRTFSRSRVQATVASIAVIITAAGFWGYWKYSSDEPGKTIGNVATPVSIAVLPLIDSTRSVGSYLAAALGD